jgi:hypothetical protein
MEIDYYIQKPDPVRAVQVTEDNMLEVAAWAGAVLTSDLKMFSRRDGVTVTYMDSNLHQYEGVRDTVMFVMTCFGVDSIFVDGKEFISTDSSEFSPVAIGEWVVAVDEHTYDVVSDTEFQSTYTRLHRKVETHE